MPRVNRFQPPALFIDPIFIEGFGPQYIRLGLLAKDQKKSKWFFQVDVSSKKQTNEFYFTTLKPQAYLLSFVFWRKLKTPKRHFEIIWPLLLDYMNAKTRYPFNPIIGIDLYSLYLVRINSKEGVERSHSFGEQWEVGRVVRYKSN